MLWKLRYSDHTQTLEMKYTDGSSARATSITKERYEQLISTQAEDRDTFLMNLIEPFVVSRRKPPRVAAEVWKMIALAVLVACSLWLLFWITDYMTSMPKFARR